MVAEVPELAFPLLGPILHSQLLTPPFAHPTLITPSVFSSTQVRFISHVMEKHSAVVAKVPELSSLARNLRSFVAVNARNWELGRQEGISCWVAAASGSMAEGCGTSGMEADLNSSVVTDASRERDARAGVGGGAPGGGWGR